MAPPQQEGRSKGKNVVEETGSEGPRRYTNIHYFANTGLWGTYIREPWTGGKRLYFGLHLTQNLALRCQDRAFLKYEAEASKPLALNFPHSDYDDDRELRDKLTHEEWRELLRAESHDSYNKVEPTSCLKRFWDEEFKLGNIPESKKDAKKKKNLDVMPLSEYLDVVMIKREKMLESSGDSRIPPHALQDCEGRGKKLVIPSWNRKIVDQAGAGHRSTSVIKRTRPPTPPTSRVGNTRQKCVVDRSKGGQDQHPPVPTTDRVIARSAIPEEVVTLAALSLQTLQDAPLFNEKYNFKKHLIQKFSRECTLENHKYKKRFIEKFARECGDYRS